jgi:hypothetical protein
MDCVYCRKDVPEDKVRLFLRVLLCEECHALASASRATIFRDLETLRANVDRSLQERLVNREPINLFMNFIWSKPVVEDPTSCLTTTSLKHL